ncbi:glycine betaine ABC transporter substrate-binding protein [Jeotgalibacillus proteolyticus]|nr:glycine betaine ABC transporter substrate-binding protein [Jeotgalibacillus proteolyticus]
MKISLKLIPLLMTAVILASCSGIGIAEKEVTVGGKNFTEQYLLSEMTAFLLVEEGFKVNQMNNLGSSVVRSALENGQVDLMWEYTGTALMTYMGEEPIIDPGEAFEKVKEIDSEKEIHWMNMSNVNNTYALAMRAEQAEELGIESISDLAEYINENPGELSMASDAEFANRADGIPGLQETYGFEFGSTQINQMDIGLTQRALDNEQVEVSVAFETDATIKSYNLIVLEDDQEFFPPYRAAVSINQDILDEYPEIEDITAILAERLDSSIMRELNYRVDIDGESVSVVAYEWLRDNGLVEE